jgi:hypothetical protein
MFYAETIGLRSLLDGMRKYHELLGPMHWQPAPLLVELVERNMTVAQWEQSRKDIQA